MVFVNEWPEIPLQEQVRRFCNLIMADYIVPEQREAWVTSANSLLGDVFERPLTADTLGNSQATLSQAIAAHYPEEKVKLKAFLTDMRSRMGSNYPEHLGGEGCCYPTVSDARTVDYELGAVLKCEGGLGAVPGKEFALQWQNRFIRFIGHYNFTQESNEKEGVDWEIAWLRIPLSLKSQTEEIKQIITEAIEAYGYLYDKENLARFTVTFSKKIDYYQDQPQQAQR